MTIEQMPWGRSIEILKGPKQEAVRTVASFGMNCIQLAGRTIQSAGVNFIEPLQTIPLHVHNWCVEDYIPQTEGLKILVVNQEQFETMSENDVSEALSALKPAEIDDVITCPNGYAHAMYNSSTTQGVFVFEKYN